MNVSVVYAEPSAQVLLHVCVDEGATVRQAIAASGIAGMLPSLSCDHVGIFGHRVTLDTLLSEGDRIEIYRPLPMDPKEARLRRGKTHSKK